MKAILLAVLLMIEPDAPLEDLKAFVDACNGQERCFELAAIASVETSFIRRKTSHKGACCYLGLLGGRYGHSTCTQLEADPALCLSEGIADLEYWERACGKSYLDAYNGGWAKCWDRPKVSGRRCSGRCDSYMVKVRKRQARIKELVENVSQWAN